MQWIKEITARKQNRPPKVLKSQTVGNPSLIQSKKKWTISGTMKFKKMQQSSVLLGNDDRDESRKYQK